ncbi:hypothetical protein D9758_017798 [Tetrapyrgos nigripes]|uniref:Uncharacterized protein n=1 Tax=Tetrapyrgos nigripes TaxID=182062 RepID=A0A8H5B8K2_9AGAR|nr:hypothetical protein D9758_017798 [Tetrapyrgos nigripes]
MRIRLILWKNLSSNCETALNSSPSPSVPLTAPDEGESKKKLLYSDTFSQTARTWSNSSALASWLFPSGNDFARCSLESSMLKELMVMLTVRRSDSKESMTSATLPSTAHHIVGNTFPYTIQDWSDDISLASEHNIDGFALNIGTDPWQPDRVADAHQAALQSGLDFILGYVLPSLCFSYRCTGFTLPRSQIRRSS